VLSNPGHGEWVFRDMLSRGLRPNGFVEPCIPTGAPGPPAGPDWVHEIKQDGGCGALVSDFGKARRRGFDDRRGQATQGLLAAALVTLGPRP
jgi:hypothetical protein